MMKNFSMDTQALKVTGGIYRSRKITFLQHPQLRPTGSRGREILFNWLGHHLEQISVLDLFSGSGILSIESISRGAKHATLVEHNNKIAAKIANNFAMLQETRYHIIPTSVSSFLQQQHECNQQFELVFSDPPFGAGLQQPTIHLLMKSNLLAINARLYFEVSKREMDALDMPASLIVLQQKVIGDVAMLLCRYKP